MNEEPFEDSIDSAPPARRCRKCFYVIEYLGERGQCPECGETFDLTQPSTYSMRPPRIWWLFWLPAFLTASITGLVMGIVLIPIYGFGWTTTLMIPTVIGFIAGYRLRDSLAIVWMIALCAMGGAVFGLFSWGIVGAFCGLILGLIGIVPAAVGAVIGKLLRERLKRSTFSQRMHLPILFLMPAIGAWIEGPHRLMTPVSWTTSQTINASPEQVWNSIQFYEEVKHAPPWLLRITPTFRPKYTTGKSGEVGDVKVCVYERGRLVKQVTRVEPGVLLAFRVIEQTDIQNRGVRLMDGRFELEKTSDGKTIVHLTTRYEPLLAPRFAFKPAERWAVSTLHGHVLMGMKMDAEEKSVE